MKKNWLILTSTSVIVLLIAILVGVFLILKNGDVVAKVGNEIISRKDFETRLEKEKSMVEFMNKDKKEDLDKKLATLKKDTINKMIEEKILDLKNKDSAYAVTDEEINKKEKEIIGTYKDEEKYNDAIKVYGWIKVDARNAIKYMLIKNKIEQKAISERSIKYILIRYDSIAYSNGPNVSNSEIALNAEKKAKEYDEKVKALGFDNAVSLIETEKSQSQNKALLGTSEYKKLRQDAPIPNEDKDTIWSLKKDEVSKLVKSSGGYYAIFKVTDIAGGSFSSYEEFIKTERKNNKVRIYSADVLANKGLCEEIKALFFGVAEAACDRCIDGGSGTHWYGYVTDSWGNRLSGAYITVENTGSGDSCPSTSADDHGWCGPKSAGTFSGGDGRYDFGPGYNENMLVNCAFGYGAAWRLTVSKPGYYSYQGDYDISGTNGTAYRVDIPLTIIAWDNLSATVNSNLASVEIDYYTPRNITFTATVNHDRGPDNHGIAYYQWDFDGNNTWDRTTTTNVTTYAYNWGNLNNGALPNKVMNVKVRVVCAYNKAAEAVKQITLNRAPHQIVCQSLNAMPRSGQVPLSVNFTAQIIDRWGHKITNYQWDFDGNNTWDKSTEDNKADYTYDNPGSVMPKAKGGTGESGVSEAMCPASATINGKPWSENNLHEIAP